MRIHYLQHVPFEDLANILAWATARGHELSRTLLFQGEPLPEMTEFDWLIVMGGPMNIYEHEKYPWLIQEKDFIRKAIANDKIVLGICLGAQLMADVLGGKVRKNEQREIGWFPVKLTEAGRASRIFGVLPERFMALHWHSDTFEIPPGAARTAESQACRNQAFEIGKAIGLQFHLESSMDSIDHLIINCADELTDGRHVQKPKELLAHLDRFPDLRGLMEVFLDNMEKVLTTRS
ncbi:MAG: GMP synthase (glutamine-hydrolyzing) subunit A [Methanosaeta sp. PtaB.Bin018]|nr:type 1 glutamine amidotransferase [Methanothrix sp.]OPX76694.1 MAG: GMP synthase (glutamine-hydrolyzing) subunit A [Methanosaeta sp. PtaB.Bin018]